MRTPEEILKLARLARLSVSSEELPLVARELELLLRFAAELPAGAVWHFRACIVQVAG